MLFFFSSFFCLKLTFCNLFQGRRWSLFKINELKLRKKSVFKLFIFFKGIRIDSPIVMAICYILQHLQSRLMIVVLCLLRISVTYDNRSRKFHMST